MLVCFDVVVSGFGWVCCFKVGYCGCVWWFVLVVDGFMVGFWILLDYWFSGVMFGFCCFMVVFVEFSLV